MSSVFEVTTHWEIIDHNIIPDQYVTYIVEVWDGAKSDPATQAVRYITTYAYDSPALEDEEGNAVDPDFGVLAETWRPSYRTPHGKGKDPLMFAQLAITKQYDRDARKFKDDQEGMTGKQGTFMYGEIRSRVELYNAFMDGVDRLAIDPDDQLAWEAVEAYRKYNAEKHER